MKLGIDFGTCYSKAALLLDGTPKPIREPYSLGYSFPSSVFVTEQREILVGQLAENAKAINLQNYRNEFKRELGSSNPYTLGTIQMLPEELIAEVLKNLKAEADKVVQGRGESSLKGAILTIPVTYQPYKRNLMREAGEKAGFQQVELLEEPIAAAIYYSLHTSVNEGDIILVYDLEGDTFNATLIQKRGSSYQVLESPKSLSNCGGIDFDREIYQVLKSQCSESLRQKVDRKDAWLARSVVAELCRNLKHQLSEEEEATIYIPMGLGEIESFSLTRQAFNRMVEPLILETLDCCEQLVRSAAIDWKQVKQILLVGGSCRIPYIQEKLEQQFKRPVMRVEDPELAICFGAAIYGSEQNIMRLGIDFGTCYSSAALLLDSTIKPIKEPFSHGYSFPSTVCLTKQGKLVIAQAAENQRGQKHLN